MLYLAEVRKQKSGGFMAKVSTEIKLLACQRNDQSWTAVPGDEAIECEEANSFESGVLIAINLNNNRQPQGPPEPAAPQIIRDLQRYSRLQEKLKEQEEEIEGWKQSLTLQAQELNKREMELEAELEQLENALEEGGGGGGASSEELEQARAEADRIREEFERKTQELEQAWAHLRGEQQRLAEQQESSQSTAVAAVGIDPEQSQQLQELANYLADHPLPLESLAEQITITLDLVSNQQDNCDYYSRQLDEQRADAQQQQQEIDRQANDWETQHQHLQALRMSLDEAKQDLTHHQSQLSLKTSLLEALQAQQRQQSEVYQALADLAQGVVPSDGEDKGGLDLEALQTMSLADLNQRVDDLQKEYDRLGQFVADQEEELKLQREAVTELEAKLKAANVYDSSALEEELADEQEQRKLLDETLVGQRRTLAEKQTTLKQYLKALRQRQGIPDPDNEAAGVDLMPVLAQLEAQQVELAEEIQTIEGEIEAIQTQVTAAEAHLQDQINAYDEHQNQVRSLEEQLKENRATVTLLWGRVNLYEELVEPLNESTQDLRSHGQHLQVLLEQAQQTGAYQQEAIGNLQAVIANLNSAG
ncbi:pilus motility taxis protein HmpF [Spirulina major]|uniref:pilus motility taxis protein HmpF n=1 Tax=Spirulina major TaxID=270636 RepID=UPI000934915A|nr:pilus motility taxis protein HmpF [Spirulina major]